MTVVLAALAAALFGCGTFLLLQRQLSRILVGLGMLGHGANLVILLAAGSRGEPTFVEGGHDGGGHDGGGEGLLDPLPQAFVLTAIVITFGVTCFLLALAYRSWALTHDDEVADDVEDKLVAARAGAGISEEVADAALTAHPPTDTSPAPGSHADRAVHRAPREDEAHAGPAPCGGHEAGDDHGARGGHEPGAGRDGREEEGR